MGSDKIELKQLFTTGSHIHPYTWWNRFIIALYAPIGISLFLFRMFLFFPISILIWILDGYLPLWLLNILRPVMGVRMTMIGWKPSYTRIPIICANHTTPFDVLPFLGHFNISVLIDKGFFESTSLILPYVKLIKGIPLVRSSLSREMDKESILQALSAKHTQLLFFPEGWDTNGKTGLLQYQKWLFSLDKEILPVAIKVSVPWLPLDPSLLGTSILKELFYIFACPWYHFELSFLPPVSRGKDQSDIEFAASVQKLTADSLGIDCTQYNYKDALEYRRKL